MPPLTPDRRKKLEAQLKKAREIQSGAKRHGPENDPKVKTWWRAQRVVVRTEKMLEHGASPGNKESDSLKEQGERRRRPFEEGTRVGPKIRGPLQEVERKSRRKAGVLKAVARKALKE